MAAPPVAAPPPIAPPMPTAVDPHGIGMAVARLGNSAKKAGKVSLGIASVLLEPGELVECIIAGKVNDLDGLGVLTDRRLLILNDRQFQPDTLSFVVDAQLYVQGIAEGTTATLTFQREGQVAQVARVADVTLAQELAQRVRARAAAG